MNSTWETIVMLAREIDDDCAAGRAPRQATVERLARAVLEFQLRLAPGVAKGRSPPPPKNAGESR